MLDAGVDLRDVQIAARHADPRTTMRYDRARQNLDRHCIADERISAGPKSAHLGVASFDMTVWFASRR